MNPKPAPTNARNSDDQLPRNAQELFSALSLPKDDKQITEAQGARLHELTSSAQRTDDSSRYEALWSNLAQYDVPSELDRRYICTLIDLLEINPPKSEMSLARVLSSLVAHCLSKGYENLVQSLGERALVLLHSNNAALECATPFLFFETHNVEQHPYLKPWIKLLAERGDSMITVAFLDEVVVRMSEGVRSTSDLLLTVSCLSQDPASASILRSFREKLSSSLQSSLQEQQPQKTDSTPRARVISELSELAVFFGLATTTYAFVFGPDSLSFGRLVLIASLAVMVQAGRKLASRFLRKTSSESAPQEPPPQQAHKPALTKSQYAAQDILEALTAKLDSRSCSQ